MGNAAVLFDPGRVTATPGAVEALQVHDTDPVTLIDRHVRGDFGDVGMMSPDSLDPKGNPQHDDGLELNTLAVLNGEDRILSIYTLSETLTVWVETVSDRSYTVIMLPEDY
jgi:hypothetical protein